MASHLESSEKARIAAQKAALGPAGLARAKQELDEAQAEHDKPIPKEVFTSFPVPDVKSISWIPVQSVQEAGKGRVSGGKPSESGEGREVARHVERDGERLGFFVQYDHVKVGVVRFGAPLEERLLISLCFFSRTLSAFMRSSHSMTFPTTSDCEHSPSSHQPFHSLIMSHPVT